MRLYTGRRFATFLHTLHTPRPAVPRHITHPTVRQASHWSFLPCTAPQLEQGASLVHVAMRRF